MFQFNEEQLEIFTFLDSLNLTYKVMGGMPRDLAHGVPFKDIDICVYNYDHDSIMDLRVFLIEKNLLEEVYSGKGSIGEGDIRLDQVMTTTIDIDIIVWGDQYKDWMSIIKNFDVNLNQYILVQSSYGWFMPLFVGEDEGTLVELRGDIETTATKERKEKMKQKAIELGWKV